MSEANHSPAPFKLMEGNCGAIVGILDASGKSIAILGRKEALKQEDIRLFLAAPELLEAVNALLSNPHVDLGDLVYQVREREGEGWEGPAVIAWNDAVSKAKDAISKATGKEGA